jgi:hypothetical protein
MNAQQISLNLVAQLDQGNIQSQAAQMAQNMSRAIEDAFQGIGSQIAATILAGVRQGLQGSIEMIGQTRLPAGFVPMTETERQVAASQATQPRGIYDAQGNFQPIGGQPQPQPVIQPGAPQPPPLQAPAAPAAQPQAQQPTEETPTEGGFLGMSRKQAAKVGMKAFSALGTGLELFGEMPSLMRQSAASGAEIQNLEARTAMRGDVEQMLAIQRLGGQDEIAGRARREEGTILAGEVAGAIGLALAPLTGGLSAGLALAMGAGALGLGADAARRAGGFNTRVEQNIMGQTQAERLQNQEVYRFLERGRETQIRGFDAARQAGAPELAGIFAGGGDANLASNSAATAREDRERLRQQIATMQANTPGDPSLQQARARETQLTERINQLESQATGAAGSMVTSQGRNVSLRQMAAQMGIGEQEFLQTMGQVGSMGGVFLGEQNRTPGANQIAELIRMQGIGLSNAGGIAGSLFQSGGMTRGESIETVRQIFEDAVSAGMDKAQVGRAMTEMAARGNQLGFGGGGVAAAEMTRGLGLANAAFGSTVEGPQMRFAQQVNQQLTQATRSQTADLGKIGGQIGAERFARRAGIKLDRMDLMEMQELGFDQAGLERFLQERGASPDKIRELEAGGDLAGQLEAEKQRGMFEAADRGLGGKRTAEQFMRRQLGFTTEAQMEAFRKMQGPIRAGTNVQPQIFDFNEKTGEFFKRAEAASGLQEQVGVDFDEKTGALTPRMRNIPAIEAGAREAPGAAPARALAQMDATQISAGLNDLNQILPVLNASLGKLIDRANSVLSGNTAAAAPQQAAPAPGTPVPATSEVNPFSFLSPSMMSTQSSFMTGKAPRS